MPDDTDTAKAEEAVDESWLDGSYENIDESTDDLAQWFDSFFGLPREVENEASSVVRLRPEIKWDEDDGTDLKLRVTGRVELPRTSDRLSLIFSGEDGDYEEELYDPSVSTGGGSAAGLQYQVRREKRSAAYLFAGFKAGPNVKLGARFRIQDELFKKGQYRFSEEVFWEGGDGFTSRTRLDLDRILASNKLLRWASKVDYGEETNGAEWNSRLAWIRRHDKRTGYQVFLFINGQTDPDVLRSRGIGFSFRRRWLREWLYLELEPRYGWQKGQFESNRDGVASVRLRLEAVIGERIQE